MKTKRNLLKAVALFALAVMCLGSVPAARAEVNCEQIRPTPTIITKRVTYLGPFNSVSTDLRADPSDSNHTVKLRGLLYYASGTVKDAPVIIYNHGHDQDRGEPFAIMRYFVKRGFVVFAPLRRGHLYEPGFRSTGVHIDNYVNKCMRSQATAQNNSLPFLYCGSVFCRQSVACDDPNRDNALDVGYIAMQTDDIRDQISYIIDEPAINATGKLVDPTRVALLGHSYGGSAVIFANGYDFGQNVTISISAAEKSWGDRNPYWETDLRAAMNNQAQPIYFLQPKNGLSLEPTKSLFAKAVNKGYRSQASIFGPAPWDSVCENEDGSCWDEEEEKVKPEWEQAHGTFITTDDQVGKWGCSAIEFINRYPRQMPE
jgi:hypothetical protein